MPQPDHMEENRRGRHPKGKLKRCFQKTGYGCWAGRSNASAHQHPFSLKREGVLASSIRSSLINSSENLTSISLIYFNSVNSLIQAQLIEPYSAPGSLLDTTDLLVKKTVYTLKACSLAEKRLC